MKNKYTKGFAPAFILVILVLVLLVVMFVRSESGPEFKQTETKFDKLIEENSSALDE